MKRFLRMFRGEQRGLSLLALTVVAAIIAILAALTSVAVTGTTSTTRAVIRLSDIAEMQKAVANFAGEHSSSQLPTDSKCVAGEFVSSQSATSSCSTGASAGADYENADENVVGVDINGDGDLDDTVKVVAIDFAAIANNKTFFPDYIGSLPNHDTDTVAIDTGSTTIDAWVVDENGRVVVLITENNY